MARLDKKVALITGGAMGLGKAIAQRLAADGAHVVISDIDAESGRATAAEYGIDFLPQDVCEEAQWPAVVSEIERRAGRLDVLINNAGILGSRQLVDPESTSYAEWKKLFAVNVDGVFLGCRAAIPAIRRAGGGAIVNMSSVAGLLATPYATAYGATKAAVRHLTKSVAQHCALHDMNIRCNSVHPGNVLTPLWKKQAEETAALRGTTVDDVIGEAQAATPLRGMTLPEDVAAAVAFLVSDDARHITGEKIVVDGGLTSCDTFAMMSRRKGTR